jgi:hypothetical protein
MLVKVWNDNKHPYTEKYKGETIHIPAHSYITMDWNEASHFLGTMPSNLLVDNSGKQKPETYKMLRIEHPGQAPKADVKQWACHSCGKDLNTKAAYQAHIEEFHAEDFVDEESKEKALPKKRGRPSTKGVKDDTGNYRDSSETKV